MLGILLVYCLRASSGPRPPELTNSGNFYRVLPRRRHIGARLCAYSRPGWLRRSSTGPAHTGGIYPCMHPCRAGSPMCIAASHRRCRRRKLLRRRSASQCPWPLLGLRAKRWIIELGTLVRTQVRAERYKRASLMARGAAARTNAHCIKHRGGGSRWISFNVIRGLINVPRDAPDSTRIWRAQRGARCIYCECCNALHDLRIDLAPS